MNEPLAMPDSVVPALEAVSVPELVPELVPILLPWQQQIPAELLYWGVVPASATTTAQASQAERYAVERWLPVDTDRLHVVATQAHSGERVVVGIEPERLRRWLADQPVSWAATWELIPDHVPPGVPAVAATAKWSLLTGEFEPAARRQARAWMRLGLLSAAAVVAVLAVIGAERRVAWAQREARRVSDETAAVIAAVFPPGTGDPSTPDERLTMAVRQAEATGSAPRHGAVPQILQRLLSALPANVRLQTEGLSTTDERVSLRVRVPDLAAAETLQRAWQAAAPELHLRAEAMQAQTQDGAAVAVITLVRDTP